MKIRIFRIASHCVSDITDTTRFRQQICSGSSGSSRNRVYIVSYIRYIWHI